MSETLYRIKPLEWEWYEDEDEQFWRAKTEFGRVYATLVDGVWMASHALPHGGWARTNAVDADDAKAICERYWVERVAAFLEPVESETK